MATLAERVAGIADHPMPTAGLVGDIPLRDVAEPEAMLHAPERPVEELWREGFQVLYADLRDIPQVVSAWAYWEEMDADTGGGYWNVLVVVDDGERSGALTQAMCRWGESGGSGRLLDWFTRTREEIADLNITALKGKPVYLRSNQRMPAWINALKSREEEIQERREPTAQAQASPWWV